MNTIKTLNIANFCTYMESAQRYFSTGQCQKSLSAVLLAEEAKELGDHPDLDAVSDDLLELILKRISPCRIKKMYTPII